MTAHRQPELTTEPRDSSPELKVDESIDFDWGAADLVLGLLTLPLMFWVLMYAVTGAEHIIATRAARMRLYVVLMVLQVVTVAVIVAVMFR